MGAELDLERCGGNRVWVGKKFGVGQWDKNTGCGDKGVFLRDSDGDVVQASGCVVGARKLENVAIAEQANEGGQGS